MSVKIFLDKEIRRFPLPTDSPTTFIWLKAKIEALCNGKFDQDRMKICWCDTEKDLITIRNDDDLGEALRNRTDEILRLHLKSKEDEKTNSKMNVSMIPPVNASSVNSMRPVMVPPSLCGLPASPCGYLSCTPPSGLSPTLFMPNYGGIFPSTAPAFLAGTRPPPSAAAAAMHKQQQVAEALKQRQQPPQQPAAKQKQQEAKEKSPAAPQETQNEAASGDDSATNVHKNILCDACDLEIKGRRYKCIMCRDYDLCEPCEQKHKHDQHPMVRLSSPQQKPMLAFQTLLSAIPAFNGGGPSDYLAKLGDTIAEILKNFGVDVDYEIRPPKNPQEQQAAESQEKSEATAAAEVPAQQQEQEKLVEVEEPKNVEIMDHSPVVVQATNQDWEILERAGSNNLGSNIYPEVMTVSDLDGRVEDALQRMKSMGFNDDGGWLRSLLQQKNADIPSVLDALHPNTSSMQ